MKIQYKRIQLPVELRFQLIELSARMFMVELTEEDLKSRKITEMLLAQSDVQGIALKELSQYKLRGISLN